MNPIVGWGLAAAALFAGWQSYGWQGLILALTLILFWLLLQFNRALRVMKNASGSPVGSVKSAVTLQSKLHAGMTLMQVITLTRSLGHKLADDPETWAWSDQGGATVTLLFERGKLQRWALSRETAPAASGGLLESPD